jgi:hypothetical protein
MFFLNVYLNKKSIPIGIKAIKKGIGKAWTKTTIAQSKSNIKKMLL